MLYDILIWFTELKIMHIKWQKQFLDSQININQLINYLNKHINQSQISLKKQH